MVEEASARLALDGGSAPLWHQGSRWGRLVCSVTEVAVVTPDEEGGENGVHSEDGVEKGVSSGAYHENGEYSDGLPESGVYSGDFDNEDQDGESVGIAAVGRSSTRWPTPIGVPRGPTYRYVAGATAAEIVRWEAEVENLDMVELRGRGARLVGSVGLPPLDRQGTGGAAMAVVLQGGLATRFGEVALQWVPSAVNPSDGPSRQIVPSNVEEWFVCVDVGSPSWSSTCVCIMAPAAVLVVSPDGRGEWRSLDEWEFFAALAWVGGKRGEVVGRVAYELSVMQGRGDSWRRSQLQVPLLSLRGMLRGVTSVPSEAMQVVRRVRDKGGLCAACCGRRRLKKKVRKHSGKKKAEQPPSRQMPPKHSRDQCKWCGERATMRCARCLCPLCTGCSYEGYCPACNFVGDAGGQGEGTLEVDEIAKQLEKLAGIEKDARKLRQRMETAQPPKQGGGRDER